MKHDKLHRMAAKSKMIGYLKLVRGCFYKYLEGSPASKRILAMYWRGEERLYTALVRLNTQQQGRDSWIVEPLPGKKRL